MLGKIAVLGSNSFGGSAFVASALAKDCTVLGISRSPEPDEIFLPYKSLPQSRNFSFRQFDLNGDFEKTCEALASFAPEVIVDFAGQGMVAESWSAPEQWYQTNIVAKVRLHQFLREQPWLKRYVRVSTPEVYGNCDRLIEETQPFNPTTPYAVSHAAIDMSLLAFFRNYGFPMILGRFANFYGKHQQLYRLIPKTILSIRTGIKLPLHGGGHSRRAFIHSEETADAIWTMLERGEPGESYHFSPDRYNLIADVVDTICRKLGVDFQHATEIVAERPGKDSAYLMDAAKARRELNWRPSIDFDEGIDRTIDWVDRHYDKMRRLSWNYIHKP